VFAKIFHNNCSETSFANSVQSASFANFFHLGLYPALQKHEEIVSSSLCLAHGSDYLAEGDCMYSTWLRHTGIKVLRCMSGSL
jgi:hypothetical protein